MKLFHRAMALALLSLALLTGCQSTSPAEPMPVLMYHDVVTADTGNLNDWMVTADKFREDMQWLKDNGYTTVLPRELTAGEELPDKPVLVTFDDGYESNYTLALPILEETDSKAVIALITERIDSEKPGFLTWEQCRALHESGRVELGSHTHDSHSGEKPGILRRDGESKADYEARIFTDLETSVERIETNVGADVTYFAHPHGQKDEWSEAFVKELFPVTATSEVATADLANGTQDMPRYNISMSTPLSQYLD